MQITIREANAVIGSLDSAYNGIILKGYYLSKRSSSIITSEYLFKVMTNKLYLIKLSDVRIGQLFQKANSKVLSESLLLLDVGKHWGFDQDHYPDKVWMINVLYTLNSNHQLFKNSIHECQSILTQEDLKYFFLTKKNDPNIQYFFCQIVTREVFQKVKNLIKLVQVADLLYKIKELAKQSVKEKRKDNYVNKISLRVRKLRNIRRTSGLNQHIVYL